MNIALDRCTDHMSEFLGVLRRGGQANSAGEIVVHVAELEGEGLEGIDGEG